MTPYKTMKEVGMLGHSQEIIKYWPFFRKNDCLRISIYSYTQTHVTLLPIWISVSNEFMYFKKHLLLSFLLIHIV